MKRQATTRELNTLQNYLAEYTTGAIRKDLLKCSEWSVRGLVNNGWLNAAYVTRIKNIISKTNALETLSKQCLWY